MQLISCYQPLWSNGAVGIEKFRKDLENEVARTPKDTVLNIGGDFNAHVGAGSARRKVSRKFGLRTPTDEAGEDLLKWCRSNELQDITSFHQLRHGGIWCNPATKHWYELDGFLMRTEQRHEHVRRIRIVQDMALSDHKPVALTLKEDHRKKSTHTRRQPAIIWEKLRNEEDAEKFHEKSRDMGREETWELFANTLCRTAKEVCGTKKRQVANPWKVGHEEELQALHRQISDQVICRNNLQSEGRTNEIEETREALRNARKTMRKRL